MTDGYNATFGQEDVAESLIDLIVGLLAQWYQYIALIALALIISWLWKNR